MSRDRAAALVLLLFALGGIGEARRLTIGSPGHPGPGFFPLGLALALGLVALALLLRPASPGPVQVAGGGEPRRHGKAALALLAGGVYAGALEPLGFVLTTFLFLVFLLTVVEPRRWTSSLALAGLTSAASHLVFRVWLQVPLPTGPWGF